MKEKIVDFIKKLKAVFANRRSSMPTIKAHLPYIQDIKADEASIEAASGIIDKLDESNSNVFAASALYYLIEIVIPVFRKWKQRIDLTFQAHIIDIQGHIKARNAHADLKEGIQALLVEVNAYNGLPLIAIEPNSANPGPAIVKRYESEREKYLQEHKIQSINLNKEVAHKIFD